MPRDESGIGSITQVVILIVVVIAVIVLMPMLIGLGKAAKETEDILKTPSDILNGIGDFLKNPLGPGSGSGGGPALPGINLPSVSWNVPNIAVPAMGLAGVVGWNPVTGVIPTDPTRLIGYIFGGPVGGVVAGLFGSAPAPSGGGTRMLPVTPLPKPSLVSKPTTPQAQAPAPSIFGFRMPSLPSFQLPSIPIPRLWP